MVNDHSEDPRAVQRPAGRGLDWEIFRKRSANDRELGARRHRVELGTFGWRDDRVGLRNRRKPWDVEGMGNDRVIRLAKPEDMESLLWMGRRFHETSGSGEITEFDERSMSVTFGFMMSSPDAVLLVVEDGRRLCGMVGALIHPVYYNVSHRAAYEVFWWVNPEARGVGGKLFRQLKAEAKAKGAMSLTASLLERLAPDKVGAFYEREGLKPVERSYFGRL